MDHMVERVQIIIKGIVQGVGFRPSVYNLAESLDLKGYVTNTSEGVLVDIEGTRVADFVQLIRSQSPSLSRITDLTVTPLPHHGYTDFTILASIDTAAGYPFTLVSPDVSMCDDCLRELLDPSDRRYLYPFINCTNCGPRYSITRSVPYDRPNTTMANFALCPECLKEYYDPHNRRFHAQPNACATCGPRVEFRVQGSTDKCIRGQAAFGVKQTEALRATIQLLNDGGIVAIKGIGGFHLACDAANAKAVERLRDKKRKSNKPFAVMAHDVERIGNFCVASEDERKVLLSNRRPIVLLRKKGNDVLAAAVSPSNNYIGCMLPYTPLHNLLFTHPRESGGSSKEPHFKALVMTSGNLSEEPIVRDNDEAIRKLSGIVDGFLLHDRDIFMRVDDSVVRVQSSGFRVQSEHQRFDSNMPQGGSYYAELRTLNSELSFMRRSRGYAPDPIALHDEGPEVIGSGADLKNTFTLTKGKFAIMSQHIGDMENYETVKFFEECLANLKAVYRVTPIAVAHDLHPGYLSTRWAVELVQSSEFGVQGSDNETNSTKPASFQTPNSEIRNPTSAIARYAIQHHYAHIGSVMAEHGLTTKVIGVAFDGTGYGIDGNLWGGEFLIADVEGFERVGQFKYVSLPGGEAAIKEPWKTAVSYVMDATGDKVFDCLERIGFTKKYGREMIEKLMIVARSREFSPLASGAGRLFDAVSALLGICDRNTFEGEAAMALEAFAQEGIDDEYHVEFKNENEYTIIDFAPVILSIINDLEQSMAAEIIAAKFHNTVVSVVRAMVRGSSEQFGLKDVALSGGTFQNLYILNRVIKVLSLDGMKVFTNKNVPCNDACISLGQAYIVRERLKK